MAEPRSLIRPPWQEAVRGDYLSMEMLGLSGFEQLHSGLSGHRARPPLGHLTGLRLAEVSTAAVAVEMPLSGWLRGPSGAISLGALAMPTDIALGGAVGSTLPPATIMATSELSLRLLAPPEPGGTMVARGRLVHAHGSVGLSEASVTDAHGRLLAHGTSLCFIPPPFSPAPEPPAALAPFEPPVHDTPDPWDRDPAGDSSGLPVGHLTGLRVVAAAGGSATVALPTSEWLSVQRGVVNGGAIALLADTSMAVAVESAVPAGTAVSVVDLKVNYLRPLAADGREATARATVAHAGRRRAIADVEVTDADGRRVALATGTAMLDAGGEG
jgi:uncharacterized protein (TIGR00369 family)